MLPFGRVLEIGVGNGKHFRLYQTHKITGIDSSPAMLKIAEKHKAAHIELMHMNGESLLFYDQSFDYVILSHIIAVVDQPDKLLEETYRVLKPGGQIFILNHFTPQNWLRHVDRSFQFLSKLLHFKSVFDVDSLQTLKKFTLLKEINFTPFQYFKLLIYRKP
jgi:phosphatidylethanolamine/phosphatidyl-N-methylethanolamine N-methyltransferase